MSEEKKILNEEFDAKNIDQDTNYLPDMLPKNFIMKVDENISMMNFMNKVYEDCYDYMEQTLLFKEYPKDDGRVGLDQAKDRLQDGFLNNNVIKQLNFTCIKKGNVIFSCQNLEKEHLAEKIQQEEERSICESLSFKRAQEIKNEQHWKELDGLTVEQAVGSWLDSISNPRTKRTYEMAMNELCKNGLIYWAMSLQKFSMRNHDVTIDKIKKDPLFSKVYVKGGSYLIRPWSEATRQQRAAAFLSFTGFLARRTGGIVKKATPSKEGESRTFHRINQHVTTQAFQDRREWQRFFKELGKISPRDCLLGKLMLQGGKRISEVLSLKVEDIDFAKGEISYVQSKTKGECRKTVITYRQEILSELMEYIKGRNGVVFITGSGKPVIPQQIERNFKKAGERAVIPFKVTPHVLRATAVTHYKSGGCSDSDIMKITGHASSEMIRMYDKSALSDNASKKINLV